MLELLLALTRNTPSNNQSIITTPDIGQPTEATSAWCYNVDRSSIYTLKGTRKALTESVNNLFRYDIATNTWTDLGTSTLLGANSHWAITAFDSDTLVCILRDLCLTYKISTGSWTKKANITAPTSNMYGTRAHTYNGFVYRFGTPTSGGNDVITRYNPVNDTHAALRTSQLGNQGQYAGTILIGDRIYRTASTSTTTWSYYDITSNTVVALASGKILVPFPELVEHDGLIYIFGVDDVPDVNVKVNTYNTVTNTFSTAPDMIRPVVQGIAFMKDGEACIYGGLSTTRTGRAYYSDILTYQL